MAGGHFLGGSISCFECFEEDYNDERGLGLAADRQTDRQTHRRRRNRSVALLSGLGRRRLHLYRLTASSSERSFETLSLLTTHVFVTGRQRRRHWTQYNAAEEKYHPTDPHPQQHQQHQQQLTHTPMSYVLIVTQNTAQCRLQEAISK